MYIMYIMYTLYDIILHAIICLMRVSHLRQIGVSSDQAGLEPNVRNFSALLRGCKDGRYPTVPYGSPQGGQGGPSVSMGTVAS